MESRPKEATNPKQEAGPAARFVDYVLKRQAEDNGFSARLRRADNPATEYQSWEILASFGVDLEKSWQRLPYCTLGAALAKAKPERDGNLGLGSAIAACYEDKSQSDQAKSRLRRILACTSIEELCQILRPLLALIASRGVKLNFSLLLQQLLWFSGEGQERVRTRWAQDFYHRKSDESTKEAGNE
ncbi:CRISPR system Cascade subunit CasB [Oceanospirillum multiglobuliferum]|uniref:Type I-E CRISPR-associated protein Cse2/CasB n=1 Tax=Oceanospirillum multiglobuliferum TaxID=64969 RepID=A0A1T4MMT1_9GAMM|nr:type I-E CRISPR-associated protein Cse2/CasB [Oceanospirillum multiglobuliferum]OPX56962.1 type I-E CRISPR-associated protein Cse2/CasB [Oceanospirillum multiglobuliferum]SJZ68181.1 CRISPR system Cascade subunit CasB [Oceanospirillum multiglobuliferum]